MKNYMLSQATIARQLRRIMLVWGAVIILLVGVLVLIAIVVFGSARAGGGLGPERIVSVVVTVGIIIGVLTFNSVRMYRQQRKRLNAIQVEFGDDRLARPQGIFPRVEIRRDEVKSIEEIQGGLCVAAAEPRRVVIVPTGLEDFEVIKTTLGEWAPIKPLNPLSRWLSCLPALLLLVGFGIVFIAWSLWLIVPVGVAIIGFYGYVLWELRPIAKTRRRIYFQLGSGMVVIILLIVGKIALVISLMDSAP